MDEYARENDIHIFELYDLFIFHLSFLSYYVYQIISVDGYVYLPLFS